MRRHHLALCLASAATLGCSTADLRNEQLEQVAKDWSLVIRASQVIPVYPLSEDLQPGDVLLVSTPIEDQVETYKAKGFLPLDQLYVRLYSSKFGDFYKNRYGITDQVVPPAHWQTKSGTALHSWDSAPRASFPSYQFSVRTGSGLNLAIPIQGVPFALGLMNSGAASGTVTIADAYTYGLDNVTLHAHVSEWAAGHRALLRSYQPVGDSRHFLRVVSRVYVTGSVSVTLNNDEASGAELAGGADKPVELMGAKEGATGENYSEAIAAINKLANDKLPGGKLKIATASSRSVSMNEEFDRPLVLGYVGFDMPILQGGRLGAPISTLAQLNERPVFPGQAELSAYRLAALAHVHAALLEIEGDQADRVRGDLDGLASLLPPAYPFTLYEFETHDEIVKSDTVATGAAVPRTGFQTVLDYLGYADTTVDTLRDYLGGSATIDAQRRTDLAREMAAAQEALDVMGDRLGQQPALMQAVDFALFGM